MSKIIVPLPKKDKIDFYLENNVDGFAIGIKGYSENFNNYVDINELEYYIDLLNSKNKDIYIVLNKLYFNDQISKLKDLLFKISKLKISGVFFDDLSIVNINEDNSLKINLIWYGIHKATNSKTINFLAKRNISGVLLSNELTIDEIIKILDNINIKAYITLFRYLNQSTKSRSLLTNYFKFIKKEKEENKYYIKEKNSNDYYPIVEEDNTNFFSSKILNGIKEYSKIISNKNLQAIYLDDYMISPQVFYNVIEAFCALKNSPNDKDFINKLYDVIDSNNYGNTYDGFFNNKTIFKVKENE